MGKNGQKIGFFLLFALFFSYLRDISGFFYSAGRCGRPLCLQSWRLHSKKDLLLAASRGVVIGILIADAGRKRQLKSL